jgi:predicted alpha/beta-hydrolase family hydrolase
MQERVLDLAGHPALLVRPRGATALYVFAHGAGAGMRHPFMAGVAEQLAKHAIATLRWEFAYMAAGKKRVDAAPVAEQAVRDVWSAAAKKFGDMPRFAGGKSFGGRMTSRAHAAKPLDELRGIAFVGFPLHPAGAPAVERAEHLAQTTGPLLFVQGTRDDLADLTLLRPIVKALGKRAALHVIDGADHGFGDKRIPELARVIAEWMTRFA